MLLAERAESERLRQIIKELQRHRFGRRAESLPEEQLQLGLEEAEQVEASGDAENEEKVPAERTARAARRRSNRGALPAHLPRIETLVDVASMICPGCSGTLHRIGEDVAERLDIVPAQFRVLVVRRPKYACRRCEDVVVQAAAPARLIEGGLPTEATVAQVLVSKYADHLPLYRQAQIYARQGVNLDRSTLADWVGRAADYLRLVPAPGTLSRPGRVLSGPCAPIAGFRSSLQRLAAVTQLLLCRGSKRSVAPVAEFDFVKHGLDSGLVAALHRLVERGDLAGNGLFSSQK